MVELAYSDIRIVHDLLVFLNHLYLLLYIRS